MNSKLAIVLAGVLGFAVATVVFAQEAEQPETVNAEITTNTEENGTNAMENQEEAPVAESEAPATY